MACGQKALALGEAKVPLLKDCGEDEVGNALQRAWNESKQLWYIAGPTIISQIANYSMGVITQVFAAHLGDIELAAMSIAYTVIIGFDLGFVMGMSSALQTLCGQAYGAKKYHMLGIYLQRSWVVLFLACVLLLPIFIFATPILVFLGQPRQVAELAGKVSLWLIPVHFSFAFQFPLARFLQSQLKNAVITWVSLISLVIHVAVCLLFVHKFQAGIDGIAATLNLSWWILVFALLAYTFWGGCPLTWTGFSIEAFSGLWEFTKLSTSSGVMLCLETWYYKILILMTANLENVAIVVDALSISMNITSFEMMIPIAFLSAIGVRVANELGAGNGKGAKFATIVSVVTSITIGIFFWLMTVLFHSPIGSIFTSSQAVLEEVNSQIFLLSSTILLNSLQPVLSGVAVGSGWQSYVAYINLGCYYILGLPLGVLLGTVFNLGVKGIWAGMLFGGTATQTLILGIIIILCDWDKEVENATVNVTKWEDQKRQLS